MLFGFHDNLMSPGLRPSQDQWLDLRPIIHHVIDTASDPNREKTDNSNYSCFFASLDPLGTGIHQFNEDPQKCQHAQFTDRRMHSDQRVNHTICSIISPIKACLYTDFYTAQGSVLSSPCSLAWIGSEPPELWTRVQIPPGALNLFLGLQPHSVSHVPRRFEHLRIATQSSNFISSVDELKLIADLAVCSALTSSADELKESRQG